MSSKREDFVKMMTVATTHDTIFLFSNKGKIFALKTYEIPQSSKTSRGKSLKGIINLATGENITAICSIETFETVDFLCMATKFGILKKKAIDEFVNAKKGGIIVSTLKKMMNLLMLKLSKKRVTL
jgi:DNA gyrase subunit A